MKNGYLAVADPAIDSHGTFTVQLDYDTQEAKGLDPQTATQARSWTIMGLVYDTLVRIGPDFQFEPGLATSWTNPSPTTYVFNLRKDAVFSNGRAMTADDVVGSIEKLQKSGGDWALQLGPIQSVAATGQDQVTITLARPYTALLGALANTPASILPMKEINDGSVDITKTMLGTGPFQVTSHVQDQSWTFSRNPHYYDAKKLGIDKVDIGIVTQESTRLAAIRDGSADYVFFNNVDALDQLGGTRNARVVNQKNTDFYYLLINSQRPGSPLQNNDVRFAINSAINRTQISDIALAGQAAPTAVTPSSLPGACAPGGLPSATTSTDSIKSLLAKAGAKNLKLTMSIYSSEPALAQIAQVIQQQLAKVGVTLTIQKYDLATYVDRLYTQQPGNFDLGLSWYAGYGDAAMVSRWWNGDQAKFTAGFMNNDPDQNALIVQASEQPAGTERTATLKKLCDTVDKNSEMIPLVSRPGVIGYRTDKVSPTINTNEGYGNILRNIVEFRLKGTA
ncbi:ABC transporter substrate-binding protein [Diaminobutyricibacter sp. McL0608]|uniref:ABC transporter substrate-binding protein n=1 Tax=Leifsonia sp. McL0608 TaxID=3143537 RepID=UPI0031F32B92